MLLLTLLTKRGPSWRRLASVMRVPLRRVHSPHPLRFLAPEPGDFPEKETWPGLSYRDQCASTLRLDASLLPWDGTVAICTLIAGSLRLMLLRF